MKITERVNGLQDSFTDYAIDYAEDVGDLRQLKTLELERQLHYGSGVDPSNPKGLRGWSQKHEINPKYKGFSAAKLNPKRYRDQRVDVNVTPPSALIYFMPHRALARVMRKKFIKTIGVRAERALEAYEAAPADPSRGLEVGGASVMQQMSDYIAAGESIFIATAHAESLDDIAINQGPVALAAVQKRSSLLRKVGTSLSKTLSLEKYLGKRVTDHFKFFGTIYWTIPESDNLREYDIPDTAVSSVRDSGMRQMMKDAKTGTSLVVAPTGSGAKLLPEETELGPAEGPKIINMPEIPERTINLLSKFRHYVVAAAWGDEVKVSSIFNLPDYDNISQARVNCGGKKLSIKERAELTREHLNKIAFELARQTANAANLPVRYRIIEELGAQAVERLVLPNIDPS